MQDERLIEVRAAQAGDRAALERLLVASGHVAQAAIAAHVGRRGEAEDLLQESFMRVCQGIGQLREPASFESWLYGIARRVALEWVRSRRGAPAPLQTDEAPAPVPEEPADQPLDALRAAVAALPEEYRETLTLYYTRKLSYQEIAELQGISRAGVNQRLTRARAMLRANLSGHEEKSHDL